MEKKKEMKDSLSMAVALLIAHDILTEEEFNQLDKYDFHNQFCSLIGEKFDELRSTL